MHMTVKDCLPGILSAVHAYVETGDRGIQQEQLFTLELEQRLDGVPFWLVKREVVGGMPLRNDQRVMIGNREGVSEGDRQIILGYNSLFRQVTKWTAFFTVSICGSNATKIGVVPITFHRIARIA